MSRIGSPFPRQTGVRPEYDSPSFRATATLLRDFEKWPHQLRGDLIGHIDLGQNFEQE
jgi:hypothetical protein